MLQVMETNLESIRWAWHLILWFITFTNSAKVTTAARLCLMLLKYCKTFFLLVQVLFLLFYIEKNYQNFKFYLHVNWECVSCFTRSEKLSNLYTALRKQRNMLNQKELIALLKDHHHIILISYHIINLKNKVYWG